MTDTQWIVAAIVVIAVALALVLGGRLGFINLTLFGKTGLSAGRRTDRASADEAEAGRDLNVKTPEGGEASANKSKAGRDVNVTSGGND